MVYSLKLMDMLEEGREIGREEGRMETLANLVKDGIISMKDAAVRSNMEIKEFETVYDKLTK